MRNFRRKTLTGTNYALRRHPPRHKATRQETVRVYLNFTFRDFVTNAIKVIDGNIPAPSVPVPGTARFPEVLTRPLARIHFSRPD